MRKSHIKSIVHDLLDLESWRHPLKIPYSLNSKKIKIDLIRGEVLGSGKDSIWEFYHKKIDWFKARVKKLNGNLKDFTSAKIFVDDLKERVVIEYKGETFEGEKVYGKGFEEAKEFNKKVKNLKVEDGVLKRGS